MRRLTICKKPKPLTDVRSCGPVIAASSASAMACRSALLATPGKSMPMEPCKSSRVIACADAAAAAIARGKDGRSPSTSITVIAGVMETIKLPPANAVNPVRASSITSCQPYCANISVSCAWHNRASPICSRNVGAAHILTSTAGLHRGSLSRAASVIAARVTCAINDAPCVISFGNGDISISSPLGNCTIPRLPATNCFTSCTCATSPAFMPSCRKILASAIRPFSIRTARSSPMPSS